MNRARFLQAVAAAVGIIWGTQGGVALVQAAPSAPSETVINTKLQAAVSGAEKQLGHLEPWQKKLFDEEAVPQASHFVKDYRQGAAGFTAEVDFPTLNDYLRFYGPKALKRENPQMLVLLQPEGGCPKCASAIDAIKKMVRERLDRRGMQPLWLTAAEARDLKNPGGTGKVLGEHLAKLAEQRKAAGALLLQWHTALAEAGDSAHADEKQFIVYAYSSIRDLTRHEGQVEIFETGSFEKSAAKLVTDVFIEFGHKAEELSNTTTAHAGDADRDPVLLEVSGVGDFTQYNLLKTALQARLKTIGTVEDQKISRGQAVFAIYTDKSGEDLKPALASFAMGNAKITATGASKQSVQMELR